MEWKARWIWDSYHQETANFYMYARRIVNISSKVLDSKAYCSCSSEYKLYINGAYIGRGPDPCDPRWQYYDEYDIGKYLHQGKNVITALCYHCGVGTHYRPYAPAGFLFQGEITHSNRHKIMVTSDDSWKIAGAAAWVQEASQMFWTIGFQEIYDSRKEPKTWMEPDFDDSSWQNARVLGSSSVSPWTNLVLREIPMLEETEVLPDSVVQISECQPLNVDQIEVPNIASFMSHEKKTTPVFGKIKNPAHMLTKDNQFTTIETPEPGYSMAVTLDFGKEVVGYPEIEIEKIKGGIIDIGYSEVLDKNGNVNPVRQRIKQTDRLITTEGLKSWSTFGRRAFRYMQIVFRSFREPIRIKKVSLNLISYPVGQRGSFECSDNLLNKIWKVGRHTLQMCMQNHFEDCPLREHGQYSGDIRIEALGNYYAFGDSKLVAKGLGQLIQSQGKNGWFKTLYPSGTNHKIVDENLCWVMALWDYYLYTGDIELIKKLYPNLCRLMDWFKKQLDEHKLINASNKKDWWIWIDWGNIEKRGEVTALECFYYKALLDAEKLALVVADEEKRNEFVYLSKQVKKSINERLWSEEKGVYVDCVTETGLSNHVSRQVNYLAILFGIANSAKWSRIYSYIHNREKVQPIRTPYFYFYALESLFNTGSDAEALNLMRSYWGGMLERGATSWWETFDPESLPGSIPECSLCHGYSVAPTFSLPAQILGVKPTKAGYKEFRVKPKPLDLIWAKGIIPTPRGDISVDWSVNKKIFEMKVSVMESCKADIAVPVPDRPDFDIKMNQKPVWSKGGFTQILSQVERTYKEERYIHFIVVGPGIYHFTLDQSEE